MMSAWLTLHIILSLSNSLNVTWHDNVKAQRGSTKLYYDVHYNKDDRLRISYEIRPLCVWGIDTIDNDATAFGSVLQSQSIMVHPLESDYMFALLFYPNISVPEIIGVDISALCESHARSEWIGLRLECKRNGVNILQSAPAIDIVDGAIKQIPYQWSALKHDHVTRSLCIKQRWIPALVGLVVCSLLIYLLIQARNV